MRRVFIFSIVAIIFLTATYAIALFFAQKTERAHSSFAQRNSHSLDVSVAGLVATNPATAQNPRKTIILTMDMDMNEAMEARYKQNHVLYYDARIFDYLEKEKIPATFFVSGLFAETYPALIQSLAANYLFSFQNHSYDESGFTTHCYWLKTLATSKEKIDQIVKTQIILKRLMGTQPHYFRYPGLCSDAVDDKLVQNLGLTINEGNIFAADPFNPDANKIVNHVLAQLKNNGIILMHVGGKNAPASYDVLVRIVPAIRAQGFRFENLLSF